MGKELVNEPKASASLDGDYCPGAVSGHVLRCLLSRLPSSHGPPVLTPYVVHPVGTVGNRGRMTRRPEGPEGSERP